MATLDVGELPTGDNVVIKTSSYFNRTAEDILLPSPAEVRERTLEKGFVYPGNPPPIRFPELGLIVKSGTNLTIAEAQCLWAIWKHLKCEIPVPELYGWVRDGGELFIYMKLIEGETLEARWDTLSVLERLDVSSQLKTMTTALRGLRQGGKDAFIGSTNRGPLLDILFEGRPGFGPFKTTKEFHDRFAAEVNKYHPDIQNFVDPMRGQLPDEAPIIFTHADLHPSNIMLTATDVKPVRVLAILDWHQSGWYPSYWEFCNMLYCVDMDGDWAKDYVPTILEKPDCFDGWWYYMNGLGF
ncbi:uncharacterized protein PAC_00068 [Phialocephala subalpina]|uniref:Aminoglycoside phosphotransferase domain-containing protein n=1 Tax=Phialocephala subalpina TaxID=576137 RepID=A0A1L7WBN7_9HELO|nr:uncharacterized protein PAC_00068 [Phialocephala subalpina]